MQFLKIRIEGNFWDTYIYMGNLYLWTYNKQLIICNWDRILADSLFNSGMFIIEEKDLKKYIIYLNDTPFNNLASDIQITNKKIYVTTYDGIYCTNINSPSNIEKLWDNSAFSLNSSGRGQVSISAGDDGLFEYNESNNEFLDLKYVEKNIVQISKSHSTNTIYSNYDIYNKSELGKNELESFEVKHNFKKKFYKSFSEEEIFGNYNKRASWIHKDRIYRITDDNKIEVKNIKNLKNGLFEDIEIINFQKWKGDILSGQSTEFGIIFECDNALVVSFEDNTYENINNLNDEITKWRVFPNSKSYLYDLHIVFEDYIDIYRFRK